MFWKKKIDYGSHPEYSSWHERDKENRSKSIPEMVFTILDTETTGFDLEKDQIISIGAIKLHQQQIQINDSLELNFSYQVNEDREHIAIHQMTPGSVEDGYDTREKMSTLLNYLQNSILVGHYISFDLSMLNASLMKSYGFKLFNATLDTAELAIRLEKGTSSDPHQAKKFGLDELCERYGITPYDRHHAAGDAFLTGLLLLKLLKIADKKGIRTYTQLMKRSIWS